VAKKIGVAEGKKVKGNVRERKNKGKETAHRDSDVDTDGKKSALPLCVSSAKAGIPQVIIKDYDRG
jgi:hypothetical protein